MIDHLNILDKILTRARFVETIAFTGESFEELISILINYEIILKEKVNENEI